MSDVVEIGAGAAYGHGWRQIWKYFPVLLGITLLMMIIGGVPGILQRGEAGEYALLSSAYQVLVLGPVSYGCYFAYLRAARGERPAVADLFAGFGNYWQVVLANFVVGLIVILGLLFLVVPGLVFICKFLFVPYLVVERRMRAFDAMNESWRMTEGHGWTLFLAVLLAIAVAIAGVMAFGVGVIVSIMWIGVAFGALYLAIDNERARHGSPPVDVP